jgi:hypothetical protein
VSFLCICCIEVRARTSRVVDAVMGGVDGRRRARRGWIAPTECTTVTVAASWCASRGAAAVAVCRASSAAASTLLPTATITLNLSS